MVRTDGFCDVCPERQAHPMMLFSYAVSRIFIPMPVWSVLDDSGDVLDLAAQGFGPIRVPQIALV